jgi:hypothetical protein
VQSVHRESLAEEMKLGIDWLSVIDTNTQAKPGETCKKVGKQRRWILGK